MNDTVSIQEANFVDRMVNSRYRVKMPAFLAAHGTWDNWEPERFLSMEENLSPGDILFDVGAEVGSISAIYARFVGAANMVLFEPNPDNWPNIKATFDLEELGRPRAGICALASDRCEIPVGCDYGLRRENGWPDPALTGKIWTPRSYRLIHEHAHSTAQISLDMFVFATGLEPKGITIDVEGAEFKVLRGARKTLEHLKPLVWVSIHPDLMLKDYGANLHNVFDLMRDMGYYGEHLATDHEQHHFFRPQSL